MHSPYRRQISCSLAWCPYAQCPAERNESEIVLRILASWFWSPTWEWRYCRLFKSGKSTRLIAFASVKVPPCFWMNLWGTVCLLSHLGCVPSIQFMSIQNQDLPILTSADFPSQPTPLRGQPPGMFLHCLLPLLDQEEQSCFHSDGQYPDHHLLVTREDPPKTHDRLSHEKQNKDDYCHLRG